MQFKKVISKKLLSRLSNKYVLVTVGFLVWLLFLDANSYLTQRELNRELQELKEDIQFYKSEIEKDEKILKKLDREDTYEKIAREKYHMKRPNEDVYIIQKVD
jgi:cell division protein FtsB